MEKPYTKEREKTVYKSEVIVRKKDKKEEKRWTENRQTDWQKKRDRP